MYARSLWCPIGWSISLFDRRWRHLGALVVVTVGLAGCGFAPLHGERGRAGTTATDLAYVSVAPIPERSGQLVRNALLELLRKSGPQGRPVFRLDVQLAEAREGLAFSRDDSVTRYNLRMNASYQLVDERSGDSVLKGRTRAIAAYNVVRSDYANLIAERDARERAARVVAEDIRTRLAVFFAENRG